MLEAEVAFVTSTTQLMDLVEDCVKHSLGKARASQDFETLWKDRAEELQLARFDAPWHRISYTAALKELNHKISDASVKFATPPKWGIDLHSEHERYLVDTVFRGPVFIYDYPRRIKPFYMLPNTLGAHEKTSRQTVANFDLLIPNSLELCGGSLRMHNFTQLQQAMENKKMLTHPDGSKNDAWDWYLDLRKYGSAPHGGFGLGFDRLLSWITGTGSVKDVVPMPRWAGRMLL
jgi:asparaginyl-tRNA synthetase